MNNEDIPNLTLRVLENIQAELVGLRGDVKGLRGDVEGLRGEVHGLRGDVEGLRGEVHGLRGDVHTLNDRFEHFLTFVGRDVQDLKLRVSALEQRRP